MSDHEYDLDEPTERELILRTEDEERIETYEEYMYIAPHVFDSVSDYVVPNFILAYANAIPARYVDGKFKMRFTAKLYPFMDIPDSIFEAPTRAINNNTTFCSSVFYNESLGNAFYELLESIVSYEGTEYTYLAWQKLIYIRSINPWNDPAESMELFLHNLASRSPTESISAKIINGPEGGDLVISFKDMSITVTSDSTFKYNIPDLKLETLLGLSQACNQLHEDMLESRRYLEDTEGLTPVEQIEMQTLQIDPECRVGCLWVNDEADYAAWEQRLQERIRNGN